MTTKTRVDFFIKKSRWLDAMAVDRAIGQMEYRVGGVLGAHMNSDSGETFVGRDTIADILGVNVKSVDRAIATLEAAGYLNVVRDRGRGRSNTYSMLLPEKATPVSRFNPEKATPMSPFSEEQKATSETVKGDISVPKRRHPCPPNLKDSNLEGLTYTESGFEEPIAEAVSPSPAAPAPAAPPQAFKAPLRSFQSAKPQPMHMRVHSKRGEQELALSKILGTDEATGWDVLYALSERTVATLCRRLKNGVLTRDEIQRAHAEYLETTKPAKKESAA